MSTGALILLCLVIGFVLGVALTSWGFGRKPLEAPQPEAERVPSTVVDRARPVVRHVVATTWAKAWQAAQGRPLKGLELASALEAGESAIERHTDVLAKRVGDGYLEAVVDIRRAAARHSTLEPALIEQAILVALQRDALDRAPVEDNEEP